MNIQLPNEELITDDQLAQNWQTTQRTLRRWDAESPGLPYVMISGRKWRPVKQCGEWLAARIRRNNPPRNPKRAA